jgi:hypothetical protein
MADSSITVVAGPHALVGASIVRTKPIDGYSGVHASSRPGVSLSVLTFEWIPTHVESARVLIGSNVGFRDSGLVLIWRLQFHTRPEYARAYARASKRKEAKRKVRFLERLREASTCKVD